MKADSGGGQCPVLGDVNTISSGQTRTYRDRHPIGWGCDNLSGAESLRRGLRLDVAVQEGKRRRRIGALGGVKLPELSANPLEPEAQGMDRLHRETESPWVHCQASGSPTAQPYEVKYEPDL